MSKVRAKFKCDSVTDYGHQKSVSLSAVTTGSEENKSFAKYTPNGSMQISIDKETTAGNLFQAGKEYYIDFSEAEA